MAVTQEAPAPAPCTYKLAPATVAIAAAGGNVGTRLETQAHCQWTATPQAPWLTLVGPSSGTGPADIAVAVAENAASAARTGSVLVAGQPFSVTQEGTPEPPPCSFDVAPARQTVVAEGGQAEVTVTASATSCTWTAVSNVPWIVVVANANGAGSSVVTLDVAANVSTSPRTGTVTVAGRTVELAQAARTATTVTLDGRMAARSGSCPTLTFKIMGTDVITDASTAFEGAPCTVLRNGTRVFVEGLPQANGSVLATRVRAQ